MGPSATYLQCSAPVRLWGQVVLPSPHLPELRTLICYLCGLFTTTCSSEKLPGLSLTPSPPLQTSQVSCFAQLTSQGSAGSQERSIM